VEIGFCRLPVRQLAERGEFESSTHPFGMPVKADQ